MYSMLPMFKEDSEEYRELQKRIKIMRMFQGNAIDKTKGISYSPPPRAWSKKQRYLDVPEGATDEQIKEIQEKNERIKFENRICCDKKAYFFGYVYPHKRAEYNKSLDVIDINCQAKFDMDFIELMEKPNKTQDEKRFIYNNQKYLFLRWTNSSMNALCRYIENIERSFRLNRRIYNFDYRCLMTCDPSELDKSKIKRCYQIVRDYDIRYRKFARDSYFYRIMDGNNYNDAEEDIRTRFSRWNEDFEQNISAICPDEEIANYMVYVYYGMGANFEKGNLWSVFGNYVAENVRKTATHKYRFQESENGVTYLNKKLELIDECG